MIICQTTRKGPLAGIYLRMHPFPGSCWSHGPACSVGTSPLCAGEFCRKIGDLFLSLIIDGEVKLLLSFVLLKLLLPMFGGWPCCFSSGMMTFSLLNCDLDSSDSFRMSMLLEKNSTMEPSMALGCVCSGGSGAVCQANCEAELCSLTYLSVLFAHR